MTLPSDLQLAVDRADDPRIADFVGLRDRDLRMRDRLTMPEESVFVAEGDIVVERAIRAGYELRAVLVDATRSDALPKAIADSGAPVYRAGPDVLRAITGLGVHRGCMGVLSRGPERSVESVLAGARRVLVLEQVVNPINLGVIVRSAVGLGFDGLLLDEGSVDPLYRRASRVAMGEVFDLPYARMRSFPDGLSPLRAHGFSTVALTPADDATDINELHFEPDQRVALALGSEGPGLTSATMAACDLRAVIPLVGRVDSLNVGAAAAIACYVIGRS